MLLFNYSVIGILALMILSTINYRLLFQRDKTEEKKAYRRFVQAIIFYTLTDVAWGFLEAIDKNVLMNLDTVLNYFAMTLAVIYSYRYVIAFLNIDNFISKHVKFITIGTIVFCITMLSINWYTPLFFYFDDVVGYHPGSMRDVIMLAQVIWFATLSFVSFQASMQASGVIRTRNKVIGLFGLTMTATSVGQWIFPFFPFNTIGFGMGLLIIHVFIHEEDEKLKMREIQALNIKLNTKHAELQTSYIERKAKEEEYRNELSKLTTMMDSSGIGVWRLTCKKGCLPCLATNDKMKELMGIQGMNLSEEEACEMLLSRINPEDMPAFQEYDRLLKLGQHTEVTYRWNHPLLGERYVRCGGVAVPSEEAYVSNGYHYDVTEQMKKEKDLRESIAANKAKTRFLQNMSHEIRTPLNAMFGFSQLLGMPDGSWTDEEKEGYNAYIYNSYNMMDMLISDILDIADSDHGNYQININDVHVNSVCEFAMMAVEFRRNGAVEMKFTTEVDNNFVIQSDARRIQQVLVNYLTNACKNTMQGSIHLHCSTTEKPGMITFSVTDTGKGVPPEKADQIFGRFTKLDQHVQGSGLGLNICQTIATKMKGEVYLDTTYTRGARFVFAIPA